MIHINKPVLWAVWLLFVLASAGAYAQAARPGKLDPGSISQEIFVSNGPKGPIHGGESSVTDMVLHADGWVYGSTEATWGETACHLFRTDGEAVEHVLNVTDKLSGQPKISDLAAGPGNIIIGATTTYNEIFDENPASYQGGHIFSYDPAAKQFRDYGIMAEGQGVNCVAVDTLYTRIYYVTYPAGHLCCYDYGTNRKKDFGEVTKPWRVKHLGNVSWRGVPKVLMVTDEGTVYYSTYVEKYNEYMAYSRDGGQIFRLSYGADKPVFTGAVIPTQKGMSNDPIYENTIMCAVRAEDGGFWCGTSIDGFLFKFYPSTSTVINKGKAFNYWNLRSMAYGGDGDLYMLGGRDYDNPWLLKYEPSTGSIECLGYPVINIQCATICNDKDGRILIAENLRNSSIYVYENSK